MLPGRDIIAEAQAPQAIDRDTLPLTLGERTQEGTRVGIEGMDLAIAEIANDERMAKLAEVVRGQGQAPGRVEGSARGQLPQELPVEVKDVDEALARPLHVVVPLIVLHRKRDVQAAVH